MSKQFHQSTVSRKSIGKITTVSRKSIGNINMDEQDEWCDEDNPRTITYDEILAASRRIAGLVVRTPCMKAHLSEKYGMELYYKSEFLQFTGCFNERGVCNVLGCMTEEQKKYGVVVASRGNHGVAAAYHTSKAQIPSYVVMPNTSSPRKINQCRSYIGNRVIINGVNLTEANNFGLKLNKEKKMFFVNGFDHPNVIEGQGTCGIEIIEQIPNVDAVLVPVGGGGLIAGVAIAIKHLKPDTEIYGIATNKCYAMAESLRKNDRVTITIDDTIADGLAVEKVGVNTFHNIKNHVDKMILVKEDWVMRAIMHLAEDEKLVVEGGGATTLAAIMAGLLPQLKGKKVVCILSGGNIDNKTFARVMERSLGAEGRLVKFKVTLLDRPGGIAEFSSLLAGIGVTIRDILPERSWVKTDVYGMELKVVAETNGFDQIKELVELIKKNYKDFYFHDASDKDSKSKTTRRGPCLAPNPICMQK